MNLPEFMSSLNLTEKEFVAKYQELSDISDSEITGIAVCSLVILFGILFDRDFENIYIGVLIFFFLFFFISFSIYSIYFKIKTNKKIKNYFGMDASHVSRLYDSILENAVTEDCLWLIAQICSLNPDAKENQWKMIKGWYGTKDSDYSCIFEVPVFMTCEKIVSKSLSYRKTIVDKLFKLAIVDDGIHNDEWNLLMNIMKQLNFNDNYIDYFQKRYGPLRTEFEADEQGEKQSTKNIPVSQLKAYFAILGLEEGASDVEIKKAYHNLALQHHPDLPKNANRVSECEELMARINEAYEKIRN